nr:PREDICTED: uncharacterized protein LOC107398296 [Tribolium castaneum]|eukprot:XP_015837416.1 PREDICTED: uncharacterized protein LOC107398296 [Tribolium castaneum]
MAEIVYGSVSKYGFGLRGYLFDLYPFPSGENMNHTWLENEILLILHYIIPWKSIYVFHPIRTSLGRHFKAQVPQGAPLAKRKTLNDCTDLTNRQTLNPIHNETEKRRNIVRLFLINGLTFVLITTGRATKDSWK